MRTLVNASFVALTLGLGLAAAAGNAQAVTSERTVIEGVEVTVHPFDFLSAADLTNLRLLSSSPAAAGMLIGEKGKFGAVSLAPGEGLLNDKGAPQKSAVVLTGAASAKLARDQALAQCNAARKVAAECVIVLEAATAP